MQQIIGVKTIHFEANIARFTNSVVILPYDK